MGFWSKLSTGIDRINQLLGKAASVMILLSCVVSAANALLRYGLDISNNWPLELQWYLFSAAVMLGLLSVLAHHGTLTELWWPSPLPD